MELLVLITGLAVIGTLVWQGYALRIMPVPTTRGMRQAAIGLMPAHPGLVIELGSGWGGMTRKLQKAFPDAQVVGYERSLLPYLASTFIANTRRGDIFAVDLSQADIVFCYLSPWHLVALEPQFKTMKPGATIISVSFPFLAWEPAATKDIGFTRVYAYTV